MRYRAQTHFPDLSISGVVEPACAAVQAAAQGDTDHRRDGNGGDDPLQSLRPLDHSPPPARKLLLRPAPLLVPIIEEGRGMDDPLVQLALEQYLLPLLERKIDVLVLGCTHYPILKPLIQQIVGMNVRVIDSAEACAEDVARRLQSAVLLHESDPTPLPKTSPASWLKTFVTDNSPPFAALASRFLGIRIDAPRLGPA